MFSDRDIKMSAKDYIITVDAQKGNSNILGLDGNEVACIGEQRPAAQSMFSNSFY